MTDSLKSTTIRAISWSFIDSVVVRGLQFIIGVLLARILFPEHFGLIGMLMVFLAVAEAFMYSGFGIALIQKMDVEQADTCSIFYFNIFMGVIAASILCLTAPWIAKFYNQPILTSMLRVLSVTLIINSLSLIHTVLLIKEVNFKRLTKVNLISSVTSGIIGVWLATTGFGVWSLVAQQVSSSFFRAITLWVINSWRPSLIFSLDALRKMFGFGSKLLFSNLLNQTFNNIYSLVIGKLFSARDLGFYSRAKSLQEISSFTDTIWRVTFPVFSKIQDDPARLKRGVKKTLTWIVLVNFPLMIGLLVISRPLVIVLLTEKWTQSIPYFRLFCVSGLMLPFDMMNMNVLMALGRSDIYLRLEIIKKILVILSISIMWRYGIIYIIYGMIATDFISCFISSYYTKIFIKYSILEQLNDCLLSFFVSVAMGIIVFIIGMISFDNIYSGLFVQIVSGVVIYIILCRLFKLDAFMEILKDSWSKLSYLGIKV